MTAKSIWLKKTNLITVIIALIQNGTGTDIVEMKMRKPKHNMIKKKVLTHKPDLLG